VELTTRLHLVPRSSIRGAIPPLPNKPSKSGAQLKLGEQPYLLTYLFTYLLTQQRATLRSKHVLTEENHVPESINYFITKQEITQVEVLRVVMPCYDTNASEDLLHPSSG